MRGQRFPIAAPSYTVLATSTRWLTGGTHVDVKTGLPTMIDVSAKVPTARSAAAEAAVALPPCVVRALQSQFPRKIFLERNAGTKVEYAVGNLTSSKKGAILATAIVAGTQAVKITSTLIPFCHPLAIEKVHFDFSVRRLTRCSYKIPRDVPLCRYEKRKVQKEVPALELVTRCAVSISGKTGVEMEALTGASVACLAIYDMLKGVDGAQQAGLGISYARVVQKRGGKSDIGHSSPDQRH